jgi:putative ABC transport system permease protein
VSAALIREIHAIDPDLSPLEVTTVGELIDRSTWAQRAGVTLLSVFGALALILATVGLYGVMAYSVSQSVRELGLRMALGAAAPDLVAFVLRKGLALTLVGLGLGIAGAISLTRLMGDLLFHVNPRDPLSFAAALATLMAASLLACALPAWRAAKNDPLESLRH